jgi:hypothetical protein
MTNNESLTNERTTAFWRNSVLRINDNCFLLRLPWTTTVLRMPTFYVSLSSMLRPAVSRSVCLGIKHPSGAYDQIFISQTVAGLLMWGALCDERPVCLLQLLLALVSAVILWSESRGTRDQILLSQIRDFLFRRLLRLAGLRWRYSNPPPRGIPRSSLCGCFCSLLSPWKMLIACSFPWTTSLIWKRSSVLCRSAWIRISIETCINFVITPWFLQGYALPRKRVLASRFLAVDCSCFQASCHHILNRLILT